jgi:hypothetical protein
MPMGESGVGGVSAPECRDSGIEPEDAPRYSAAMKFDEFPAPGDSD